MSVSEAEDRLLLDWSEPLRDAAFAKAVYRLASPCTAVITRRRAFARPRVHGLRHTYASLFVAAGIPPLENSRFMGQFQGDDHARPLHAPIPGRPRRSHDRARRDWTTKAQSGQGYCATGLRLIVESGINNCGQLWCAQIYFLSCKNKADGM